MGQPMVKGVWSHNSASNGSFMQAEVCLCDAGSSGFPGDSTDDGIEEIKFSSMPRKGKQVKPKYGLANRALVSQPSKYDDQSVVREQLMKISCVLFELTSEGFSSNLKDSGENIVRKDRQVAGR